MRELLATARGWLAGRGVDSPRLTAEVLLAHALKVARIRLYTDLDKPLEAAEVTRFRELVRRRAAGEPTQYVTGSREFYGRTFKCDRRALIPRPETELLVECVLRHVAKDAPARLLDVGCGCGTIGLTLAAERPAAHVVLADLSPEAASLARENAVLLDLTRRVEVRTGDLLAPMAGETFDAIAGNLPYVPSRERATLPVHIRDHEPALALFGGDDGLETIRRMIPAAVPHLRSGGLLVLEHGAEHGDLVRDLFDPQTWETPVVESDLAGFDRFVRATRR